MLDRASLDNYITGHWGEDSVNPDDDWDIEGKVTILVTPDHPVHKWFRFGHVYAMGRVWGIFFDGSQMAVEYFSR
jgi:hypothetical protein